ncbi:MAG TPA: GGDEF domain-containing protein [Polyangiaceae bacterium]|nr:GGDEF domain-containing protein [Polyangiaceae bacterium]
MSENDEKTRVTQVVQAPPPDQGTGNDCVVVIYAAEPGLLGKRYVLEKSPVRIGRGADNQIVLEGDSVSRRHCHFDRRQGTWHIVDDGSTNGTFLNEEQVKGFAQLNNGDRVKVGPTILKYLSGLDAEAKYHEEIYRMTIVDGLTQIHNKRYLFEALDKELIRARRYDRQLSLLIFDIDYFKNINDQYGHLAGDHVLRELARIVQERIRRDEVFARYGGEEFVIVLPETPLAGGVALAENLRGRVETHPFAFQGERIPVTISVGCAMLGEEKAAAELIQRADDKLYEAKRGGRNRVCS